MIREWRLLHRLGLGNVGPLATMLITVEFSRDNRVRAIAKHVFGLTQVNWNQDTDDWEIGTGQTTSESVNQKLTKWINGPKTPGLSESKAGRKHTLRAHCSHSSTGPGFKLFLSMSCLMPPCKHSSKYTHR